VSLRGDVRRIQVDLIEHIRDAARDALIDLDADREIKKLVQALRLALQQWEALVRAAQVDGRPAQYAIANLGTEVERDHEQARAYLSRLEALHGLTEAQAQ
jgi:hypothetical protein